MPAPNHVPLRVLSSVRGEGLQWCGSPLDAYFVPSSSTQIRSLIAYLQSLPDGCYLPVRGRDFETALSSLGEWDYGVARKSGNRLFFLYETGDIESLPIRAINYETLIHFCATKTAATNLTSHPKLPDVNRVVLINHGWSPKVGPDYALIRSLESVAVKLGWKAVVPDFRPSYRYGETRGRAERIRQIYEELLCLEPKPETVVLVGHSQGGACSSLACTNRVVQSANIKGLMLLGSESPLTLDAMNWVPMVEHCGIVHATKDNVIDISEMRRVAKKWGLMLMELDSNVEKGAQDCWGDDIHHDFLAKDLLTQVVSLFQDFLVTCQRNKG